MRITMLKMTKFANFGTEKKTRKFLLKGKRRVHIVAIFETNEFLSMKKPYANDAIKIISDVSLKFLNDVLAIMTSRKINRLLTITWLGCMCEKPFEAPHSVVKRTTQHAFQMHGKSIHFNGISAILLHDFRLYHKALSVW